MFHFCFQIRRQLKRDTKAGGTSFFVLDFTITSHHCGSQPRFGCIQTPMVQESLVLLADHLESNLRPPKHTRHSQSSVKGSFLSTSHLESHLEPFKHGRHFRLLSIEGPRPHRIASRHHLVRPSTSLQLGTRKFCSFNQSSGTTQAYSPFSNFPASKNLAFTGLPANVISFVPPQAFSALS